MARTFKYRTVKHTSYEKCSVSHEYYTIQYEWKFFKWRFWSTLKELNCGWGDCHKTEIRFDSESDAINAINKLMMGNIADGQTKEVVTILDFKRTIY